MNEVRITRIRVNHLRQAMGVTGPIHISWQYEGGSCRQERAEVSVSIRADGTQVLGRAETDSRQSVDLDLDLPHARRVFVTIRAITDHGSAEGRNSFVTGIPGDSFTFISADQDEEFMGVTEVFTSIEVKRDVEEAYLYSTALGTYHVYLDGKRIDDYEMAPGWTSYGHRVLCQTLDVTAHMTGGKHEIAARTGPGWYKGEMGFLHNRRNYGSHTAFACVLVVRYDDGTAESFSTDRTWQGADTATVYAEIYQGEHADLRLGRHGIRQVSLVEDAPRVESQAGGYNRVMQVLKGKKTLTPKGETVIDFGQNLTGTVRVKVRGRAGDRVHLKCFETLDAQGNVYTANLRKADNGICLTLSGGEDVYAPLFTFQGFRYVHVLSWPGDVGEDDLQALVIHAEMEETGTFACSNPLLNQLWHNILWSFKGNSMDIPTDCPQRDERLGWTGDAQIFSAAAPYFMDSYVFFSKWMRDVALDQKDDGGVAHVVPDLLTGSPNAEKDWLITHGTYGAAGWGDVAVILPYNIYLHSGDDMILRAQFDSMQRWIGFMEAHSDGCVWSFRLQFGDWVALDAQEGSYFGATPLDYTCAAYYIHSVDTMVKVCRALGRADEDIYRKKADTLREDFRKRFLFPGGRLRDDTQTAYVLALSFDLVPEADRQAVSDHLCELLRNNGGHLTTGFMGTPEILRALSETGRRKEAMELLEREDFPSWLYQVKMGATTIWEHWDGIRPDGSMWSPDMNSLNHYAYGSVGRWMMETIIGISPSEAEPGYREIMVRPGVDLGLDWAEGSMETPFGRIKVAWTKKEGHGKVYLSVPPGSGVRLCMGCESEVLGSGEYERGWTEG